jgi:hypothetical protein
MLTSLPQGAPYGDAWFLPPWMRFHEGLLLSYVDVHTQTGTKGWRFTRKFVGVSVKFLPVAAAAAAVVGSSAFVPSFQSRCTRSD